MKRLIIPFLLLCASLSAQKTVYIGNATTGISESDIRVIAGDSSQAALATATTRIADSLATLKLQQLQSPDLGADHYVAIWGNDTWAGTHEKPFATIQKFEDVAVPGDTCYVRGGIYQTAGTTIDGVTITADGTAGNPICLWAYPGETPIYDCSNWTYVGHGNAIHLSAANYWHIKGIEIRNLDQTIIISPADTTSYLPSGINSANSDHVIFENLNIHDIGWTSLYVNYSNDVQIINCDFYNNYDPLTYVEQYDPHTYQPGTHADGLRISWQDATDTVRITGCRFYNNSDDGVDCFNTDGVLYFDKCWSFDNGRVHGEYIEFGGGTGFKLGPMQADATSDTIRYITNCIAAMCNAYTVDGMNGCGYSPNGGYFNVNYFNNIAYRCGGVGFASLTDTLDGTWRNNLEYDNYVGNSVKTTDVHDHNSWDSSPARVVTDADFISLDTLELWLPRKSDGSLPDIDFLHLKSTSDLVESGVDVGISYSGFTPDIGAFETGVSKGYMINAGDTTGVAPIFIGQEFIDTTNHKKYYAEGTERGDWILLNLILLICIYRRKK